MWSPRLDTDIEAGPATEGVSRLLDLVFGLFIWAAHFVIVYASTAVACAVALGPPSADSPAALLPALGLLTVGALAVVLLHALRRYRQQREIPEQHFRMAVTIGCDAIAAVAIVWQLFPILLVPPCA